MQITLNPDRERHAVPPRTETAGQIVARNGIVPWYERAEARALLARCRAERPRLVDRKQRFGRHVELSQDYEGDLVEALNDVWNTAFAEAERVALAHNRQHYRAIVDAMHFSVSPQELLARYLGDDPLVMGIPLSSLALTGLLMWGFCGACAVNWAFPL